jgi:hypothetical protein
MMFYFWRKIRKALRGSQQITSEAFVLSVLWHGGMLRSQRSLDGDKVYHLVTEDGVKTVVDYVVVHNMRAKRLIETNHKFPAAAYLLTELGAQMAALLTPEQIAHPLTARGFVVATDKD